MEFTLTLFSVLAAVALTLLVPFALMFFSPLFRVFIVLMVAALLTVGILSVLHE